MNRGVKPAVRIVRVYAMGMPRAFREGQAFRPSFLRVDISVEITAFYGLDAARVFEDAWRSTRWIREDPSRDRRVPWEATLAFREDDGVASARGSGGS